MTKEDYFKPTYICGIYNGAETGTKGWSIVNGKEIAQRQFCD